jgi:hypothetical protein
MGWWRVQQTDDVVGDDAFDLIRTATKAVAALYKQEFDRLPTRSEWQLLMSDALEPAEDLETSSKELLVAENDGPLTVEIVLKGSGPPKR